MIVLRCVAPKANGLASGSWFYVANEYAEIGGRRIATITKNPARAMQFSTRAAAEEFNQRMLKFGNLAKPFQIQETK